MRAQHLDWPAICAAVNPCVTDANIVLGKLNQKKILGGRMDVDIELAKNAVKTKSVINPTWI